MEMTVRMPANYNLMTADEMTYTTGGAWTDWYAGLNVAGDVVGAVMTGVMIVNWLDMLGGARNWYSVNKTDDIITNVENGIKAWVDYTSSSAWNAVRSIAARRRRHPLWPDRYGCCLPHCLMGEGPPKTT